ncbi:MAG: hypothetical protein J0L94_10545, partial [Rhodothermia bacterium]|nr:hypothetical protein [Rhodothermia bacterium]
APVFALSIPYSIKLAGLTPLFLRLQYVFYEDGRANAPVFALSIPYSIKMAGLMPLFFTGSNFCTRKSKEERSSKIFVDAGTCN